MKDYLEVYAKKLSPGHVQQIVQGSATGNPLFLCLLLDQMIHMATFDNLATSLNHYLSSKSPAALFTLILEDWEATFSPELVSRATSLLALSHAGVAPDELQEILGLPGQEWEPFYYTLKAFTAIVAGRASLYYQCMQHAVESRYLPTDTAKNHLVMAMASYFDGRPPPRAALELPFLLARVGAEERLLAFLCDAGSHFAVLQQLRSVDIAFLFRHCSVGSDVVSRLARGILASRCPCDVLERVFEVLAMALAVTDVMRLAGLIQELYESEPLFTYLRAVYFERHGEYQAALDHLQLNATSRRSLALLGLLLKKLGCYDEAYRAYQRSFAAESDPVALAEHQLALGGI